MRHFGVVMSLVATAAANKSSSGNSGVATVIATLEEMVEKGKKEAQAEKETFATFEQWCAGTTVQLAKAIQSNKEVIAMQTAVYDENTALSADKQSEITAAQAEIAGLEGEIAKEKKERDRQHEVFKLMESELSGNIAACEQAKGILKKERDDPRGSAAFVQVTNMMSATQRTTIQLLMKMNQAPAWQHENKSGQVIQMIDDLMAEFVTNLQEARVKEGSQRGNHSTIQTQKHGMITLKNEDIGRWKQEKGKADTDAAEAAEIKAAEEATFAENTKTEKTVKTTCATKTEEFAARQKLREDEFIAIQEAIKALHGAVGTGGPRQADDSGFALLQLGKARVPTMSEGIEQTAALFRQVGEKHHSKQMMLLSISIAEGGPFDKVVTMIKGLRTRLIKEDQEATAKHMKCSAMMDENKQSIDDAVADISTFENQIASETGTIVQKTDEITALIKSQKDSDDTIKQKDALRAQEREQNTQTIADATQAIEGVELAMKIMSEFQAKADDAEALVQQPVPVTIPQTWDQPYKGSGEGGSILDVLQILLEDFMTEKNKTEMDESTQKKEQEDFLYDEKVAKTQRDMNLENARKLKANAEENLAKAQTDLENSQDELKGLKVAKDDIEITQGCVKNAGMTMQQIHEVESTARLAEIESLKQGLAILNNVEQS